MTPSCAILGGFAIGARVALLWQHKANAKCQRVHACTRSVPSSPIASLFKCGFGTRCKIAEFLETCSSVG